MRLWLVGLLIVGYLVASALLMVALSGIVQAQVCEPLVWVGTYGACEKHNTAACSLTSTSPAEVQGFIIPFDHSPPGAYTLTPGPEWYKTEDEYGEPPGGYCVPTTDGTFVGQLYFQAGAYRQTGNGTQSIVFTTPAYPATEETIFCDVTYEVDTSQVSALTTATESYCLRAVLRDVTLNTEVVAGTACAYVSDGGKGSITIPFEPEGMMDWGDSFLLAVYTVGTPPSGAAYKIMHRTCGGFPHE